MAVGPRGSAVREEVALVRGSGWHEIERVDLAVRVRDRRADFGAAVLEHQHVGDVVTRAERRAAVGPQVDDLARALDAERCERGVVA